MPRGLELIFYFDPQTLKENPNEGTKYASFVASVMRFHLNLSALILHRYMYDAELIKAALGKNFIKNTVTSEIFPQGIFAAKSSITFHKLNNVTESIHDFILGIKMCSKTSLQDFP